MTARPPRAPSKADAKADGRRARVRGATHGDKERPAERVSERAPAWAAERAPARAAERGADRGAERGAGRPPERASERAMRSERVERVVRPRATSLSATDEFERVLDETLAEHAAAPEPELAPLRLLVLESAAHLATAQGAIVAAGHMVVSGASGREGLLKLGPVIGEADALLVGLPGGEPLIELARAHPRRPVVIAASTASPPEAVRRAIAAGADLAVARPHDLDRLAPVLLAAARIAEHRRAQAAQAAQAVRADASDVGALHAGIDAADSSEMAELAELAELDLGLCAFERLVDAGIRELARARRYGYALTVALFSVELAPPEPPPALRGIVRARCGNALVHALRDIDLASELAEERFLVLMPLTERAAGADVARRIISAVASGEPVASGGRIFPPKLVGAVVTAVAGEPAFETLVAEVTQLLEQAHITGASLAVET